MIVKGTITQELISSIKGQYASEPLYPEKIAPDKFHVAYDGIEWQCFQNEEGDKTNDLTKTPMTVIFSADWDGISDKLVNVIGDMPKGGILFMGWPQS
jgi:hypothetical protein